MKLRCGVVQMQSRPADRDANFDVIENYTRDGAQRGCRIIAFPEMCITGYWHTRNLSRQGWEALAEPVPDGYSSQRLLALARELDVAIGAGLIERSADGRLFNTYVVAMPGGECQRHRKLHAFESVHVSSGDEYTVFDTPWGVKVGILICWDNNLVENVRATALLGADILLAPHQTGGTDSPSPHGMKPIDVQLWNARHEDPESLRAEFQGEKGRGWLMRWLPSRAHDNGIFVLFANGVGADDDQVRTGNAMILDPYGRVVNESAAIEDDLIVADLDLDLLPLATGRRWIRGRRPELYGVLARRFGNELLPREARFSRKPATAK